MNKTTRHTIVLGGEQHGYSLTANRDGTTRLICREARLNQDFANEDLAETIQLLPEYIKNARTFMAKQGIMRFRVSADEKLRITKNARKAGHKDVSKFLRERALA